MKICADHAQRTTYIYNRIYNKDGIFAKKYLEAERKR